VTEWLTRRAPLVSSAWSRPSYLVVELPPVRLSWMLVRDVRSLRTRSTTATMEAAIKKGSWLISATACRSLSKRPHSSSKW